MEKTKSRNEIDMCNGPLFGKIIVFAIPLMLSSVLQLLFNAADIVVVGRFAGSDSLAAVGSTSSLINLLVNLFIGLSIGANVVAAKYYGAKKEKEVRDTVHTAITVSLLGGVFLAVFGVCMAPIMLEWMGAPENVLHLAAVYLRIYFCGMPFMMLYNFGSAILRVTGDTKRPLYFLTIAGVANVLLNLALVVIFHLGVAGVAIATVVSNIISSLLIFRCLLQYENSLKIELKDLRIHQARLLEIVKIGLPAGCQGMLFSISNVVIQSSINSFGAAVIAGNTAAVNIEGFVYASMDGFSQAAITFISQNVGARKLDRVKKVIFICLGATFMVGLVLGGGALFFGKQLLGIYSTDGKVIGYGLLRMTVIMLTYYLCGMMNVMAGAIRGIGFSAVPMIVSIFGVCVFRLIWIGTIFQWDHTLSNLFISYPISWGLTLAAHVICFLHFRKKILV